MYAQLLDGKAISAEIIEQIRQGINPSQPRPGLAVVLVGDHPASQVYVRHKQRACNQAGLHSELIQLSADSTQAALLATIDQLNARSDIHGILVQLPLPAQMDEHQVTERIAPHKDVDGFHPYNIGRLTLRQPTLRPCTPKGIMTLLQHTGIPLQGKDAVIVGQSNIVGRPMLLELLLAGCTPTLCHSKTVALADKVRAADIVIAAVGIPSFIQGDWIKPDAVVIDVGINRLPDGRLCGDVDYTAACETAAWITPVPGGVGPMTVASLLQNTAQAAAIG